MTLKAERIRKGEDIRRTDVLNRAADAHNRLVGRTQVAAVDSRRVPGPINGVRMFRIIEVFGDYLECQYYSASETMESESNGERIRVAKPYVLQKTPWDGQTLPNYAATLVEYDYDDTDSTGQTRDVTPSGGSAETQVVVPGYRAEQTVSSQLYAGDVIVAVANVSGWDGLEVEGSTPVRWMDLNVDGRMWAEQD